MKLCVFDDRDKCVACGSAKRNIRQVCVAQDTRTGIAAAALPLAASGPGTELSKLLKKFGIDPTLTCDCRAKAAQMDAWGCDECERPERIDEVVAVMREEAQARGLPFLDVAGRLLVRRAIANARRRA
jgi:hypothetical protein